MAGFIAASGMTTVHTVRPQSDEYDALTHSNVMANRINDVMAHVSSKRYQDYLKLIIRQYQGEPVFDHNDQYRERAKELVPRALAAYEKRHGVTTSRDLLYHHDQFQIAAAPDAVDGNIGITVHIRKKEETYDSAVGRGLDEALIRHAQAMMAITGLPTWIHLNYWEEMPRRRLFEHDVIRDDEYADKMEAALIYFISRTRFKAAG